jgi:hypothetical protein
VLVSNARSSSFGQTAERDVASVDRLFAAGVPAAHALVEALASKASGTGRRPPHQPRQRDRRIALAGGAAYSDQGDPGGETRSWAEFSPSGIGVNAIASGPVLTNGGTSDRIEAVGAAVLPAQTARGGVIANVVASSPGPKPAASLAPLMKRKCRHERFAARNVELIAR